MTIYKEGITMLRLKYRRIIALILSVLLMFGICGVAAADDSSSSRLTLEDKLTAMLPALDSVARAIGVQGEVGYAPRAPQFFWTVIYLMGHNWGYQSGLYKTVERNGTVLTSIPSQSISDMAAAAFFDYSGLPELIDTSAIEYDAASGCYLFAPSDVGDTYTAIDSYFEQENGNVSLVLGLYSAKAERVGGFEFTLVQNADASTDSQYCYSIMAACAENSSAQAE